MPLLDQSAAAYIAVVATIIIGIFFTKDDKRNFENIVSNIVSFVLLLATVDFPRMLLLGMSVYLIVGGAVAYYKIKDLFFLFGSKTYGSLSLMILLGSENRFGLTLPENLFTQAALELFLGWMMLAAVAHIVGFVYWNRKSPGKKKRRSSRKRRKR